MRKLTLADQIYEGRTRLGDPTADVIAAIRAAKITDLNRYVGAKKMTLFAEECERLEELGHTPGDAFDLATDAAFTISSSGPGVVLHFPSPALRRNAARKAIAGGKGR